MCDLEAKNIPCSYHPVLEAGAVIWLLPRSTSFGRLLTSSSFADKSTLFGQGCVFSELLVNGYMSGLFGLEAFYIYINRLRELMCRRQFRSEISSCQFGSGPFYVVTADKELRRCCCEWPMAAVLRHVGRAGGGGVRSSSGLLCLSLPPTAFSTQGRTT